MPTLTPHRPIPQYNNIRYDRQRAPLIVCTLHVVPEIRSSNFTDKAADDGSGLLSPSGVHSDHLQRQRLPKMPSYCLRLKNISAASSANTAITSLSPFDSTEVTSDTVATSDLHELDDLMGKHSQQTQASPSALINDLLQVRSIDICDRLKRDYTARQIPTTTGSITAIEDTILINATDCDSDEDSDLDVCESSSTIRNTTGIALNLDGYEMDRFGHLPGDSRTPTPREMVGAWVANRSAVRVSSPKTRQVIRVTMNDYGVGSSRPNSHLHSNSPNNSRNRKEPPHHTATQLINKWR